MNDDRSGVKPEKIDQTPPKEALFLCTDPNFPAYTYKSYYLFNILIKDALNRSPEAEKFFYQRSQIHQKEYVRWIEEAKRDQIRQRRLSHAVEMLEQQKKAP